MADNIQFKDFSEKRTRVLFRIDDDEFEAFPAIPIEGMQELMALGSRFSGLDKGDANGINEALTAVRNSLDIMLLPDSAELFKKRMAVGAAQPISLAQFMAAYTWLSEVYAARPTQSPDTSSTSSRRGKSGTASTATTKRAASTPATSRSKTSSTSSTTGSSPSPTRKTR